MRLPDAVLRPAVGNVFETTVEQLATAIRLGVFVAGDQLQLAAEQAALRIDLVDGQLHALPVRFQEGRLRCLLAENRSHLPLW